MQLLRIAAITFAALAGTVRACTDGTYTCYNPNNGTSSIQVCSGGAWTTAADCRSGWKCAVDAASGYTCRN